MCARRFAVLSACIAACALSAPRTSRAEGAGDGKSAATASAPPPWCAPEVTELSDHVCFFDGGAPESGRRTLVVYLHGALAMTPRFQYLQQRAMALHAQHHHFTVVMPTAPGDGAAFMWPTAEGARKAHEADVLAGIAKARADVEARVGHPFDETFVVGFSSGAYYGSSLAVRGALDVDGYIILAGGAGWARSAKSAGKRAPVFVGVSAADRQTADDSRAFGRALAAMGWPSRVEERNVGHMVDWTFMANGIAWLRGMKSRAAAPPAMSN